MAIMTYFEKLKKTNILTLEYGSYPKKAKKKAKKDETKNFKVFQLLKRVKPEIVTSLLVGDVKK